MNRELNYIAPDSWRDKLINLFIVVTWEDNIKMDRQGMGCGGYGLDRSSSG